MLTRNGKNVERFVHCCSWFSPNSPTMYKQKVVIFSKPKYKQQLDNVTLVIKKKLENNVTILCYALNIFQ